MLLYKYSCCSWCCFISIVAVAVGGGGGCGVAGAVGVDLYAVIAAASVTVGGVVATAVAELYFGFSSNCVNVKCLAGDRLI